MKKNPLKPHSFWGDGKTVLAVAHRGGGYGYGVSRYEKENTVAAFSAVSELGYRYIELDVIVTADREVVVLHVAKNRLEAMVGKKDAPNSNQLQKMRYAEMKLVLDRDVPTLKQVLSAFPETNFLIDAKSDDVVQPLAELISNLKAINRVCVGSFYPSRLKRLNLLLGENAHLRLIISRSPWHLFRQLRYLRKALHQTNHISAVDWPFALLNRPVVNWAHQRDLRILAWVPNSRWMIRRSLTIGADGVISDRAELLREIILQKDSNNPSFISRV